MSVRKLLVSLLLLMLLIATAAWNPVEAWYEAKPTITVIVDAPEQVLAVDLLVPLTQAPILLDDSDQPIDHPLNGYLSPEGYGSATLYSTDITLIHGDEADQWQFESSIKIQAPFHVVVIETNREIYVSEPYTLTTISAVARWTNGMFSYQEDWISIQLDGPTNTFHLGNLLPYLIVLLIAMIDFPLLYFFGYRLKRDLMLGGLFHVGAILFLAVVNRVYHVTNNLAYLFIILILLATITVGEAVLFAMRFHKRSTTRSILVSLLGMFVTSFLLFLYMGSGVF